MTKETIYLVGDFGTATLERWKHWAAMTGREAVQIDYQDIPENNPVIIMDDHALNHAPLPGDTP